MKYFLAFLPAALAKPEIKAMEHDIRAMTASQFNSAIGKFRDQQVHALWFYKDTSEDEKYLSFYNKQAGEFKDIITFHAIDCDANSKFCEENSITSTPAVKYYPPNAAIPAMQMSDKHLSDEKQFSKKLKKQIPAKVAILSADATNKEKGTTNIDEWVSADPTKPKIVLFSEGKTPAWKFNAMSSAPVLERTIDFGFASKDMASRFSKAIGKKKHKFPMLVILKDHGKQGERFTGDMNYRDMKEWVNTFSESGMGDKIQGGGAPQEDAAPLEETKPWLAQEIPELTEKSHRDVCFKKEGLCVMYLKNGKITDDETNMLKKLESKHKSQLDGRGTVFRWMFMDMGVETEFKKMFEPAALPAVVVFNPHKRLRWTKPETEDPITESDINNQIDKILGGDARFKVVKGQKLPGWAKRDSGKQEL